MIPEPAESSMTSPESNEALVRPWTYPSVSLSNNSSSNDDPSLCQSPNNSSVENSLLDNAWFSKYEQAMAICGPKSAKLALAKRFHQEVYGAAADAQYRDHALAARLHSKYPEKDRRERNNNNSDEELIAIPSDITALPLSPPVDPPHTNSSKRT